MFLNLLEFLLIFLIFFIYYVIMYYEKKNVFHHLSKETI